MESTWQMKENWYSFTSSLRYSFPLLDKYYDRKFIGGIKTTKSLQSFTSHSINKRNTVISFCCDYFNEVIYDFEKSFIEA